jgi:protoporphyrinogen IX oxidase
MQSWQLWIKVLHIVAVIAWMAGLFYLPRLFVYHVDAPAGSKQSETFKLMERRLLKAIINPAMIAVWLTGPLLAYGLDDFSAGWLHAKLALVLVLSAFHGYLARLVKVFAADANRRSAAYYRVLNEAPTVLMALIVVLVVVKPF